VRVFGEPMAFWERNMPAGMFLRSNWTATQISCPYGDLTLEADQNDTGDRFATPVPLDRFVRYGLWFQRKGVSEPDRRTVVRVERQQAGFRITLERGEIFHSRRLIVAVGIGAFCLAP